MLLNNKEGFKDGISCDLCGFVQKNRFLYYSLESKGVEVNTAAASIAQLGKDLDIDVCEKCYAAIIEGIKKYIVNGVKRGTIKCDLCPKIQSGSFKYHTLLIHKVLVDKDVKEKGPADVQMNVMDLNLDDQCFIAMANQVLANRQKVKNGEIV
jgi:hypothetical protein